VVRKHLKSVKDGIRRFEATLNAADNGWAELSYPIDYDTRAVRDALAKLGEVCDRGLAEVPKGGHPSEPGRLICAIVVVEAWTKVHGQQPSAASRQPQQRCDDYWRACGYPSLGYPRNWERSAGRRDQRYKRVSAL